MSVKRCQSEVDSAEFAEWIAYDNTGGFSEIIDAIDYAQASIRASAMEPHRDRKKRPQPFDPRDMLMYKRKTRPQTKKRQKDMGHHVASMFGSANMETHDGPD
jgi:hypothetical protein